MQSESSGGWRPRPEPGGVRPWSFWSRLGSRERIFFFLYFLYLLLFTLAPYGFSVDRFSQLMHLSRREQWNLIFHYSLLDFFDNILLFLPFGIFLRRSGIVPASAAPARQRFLAASAGLLLSGCIETAQLFIPPRSTTINDVAFNVAGTLAGFVAAPRLAAQWARLRPAGAPIRRILLVFYPAALLMICLFPLRLDDFRGWNPRFPLLIGNETTGDRPWKGSIGRFVVFDRLLDQAETKAWFASPAAPSGYVGPLLDFRPPFSEGQGILSAPGSRLTMRLDGGAFRVRRDGGGIDLDGPKPLRADSAEALAAALMRTNAMTLLLRFRTGDPGQKGPARIVTFSKCLCERNFTVGQEGPDLHVRVRTLQAGPNGSNVTLVLRSALADTAWHDVSILFFRGYARGFVDGRPAGLIRTPDRYLPPYFGMGLGSGRILLFWFAVLLPFALLIARGRGGKRISAGVLGAAGLFCVIRIVMFLLSGQPIGF
jgi:glycopeptide antibiotics resistance protein